MQSQGTHFFNRVELLRNIKLTSSVVELSSCCRLCASHLDVKHMKKLFEKASSIPTKIFDVIRIQVTDGDGLPSAICSICWAKLSYFHEFIEKSLAVDNLFRDILTQAKELVTPDWPQASDEVELVAEVKEELEDDEAVLDFKEEDEVFAESITEDDFDNIPVQEIPNRKSRQQAEQGTERPNAQLLLLLPVASPPLRPPSTAGSEQLAARSIHRIEHPYSQPSPSSPPPLTPHTLVRAGTKCKILVLRPMKSAEMKEEQAASANKPSEANKCVTRNTVASSATKKGHVNYVNTVACETTNVRLEGTPLNKGFAGVRTYSRTAKSSACGVLRSRLTEAEKPSQENRPLTSEAGGGGLTVLGKAACLGFVKGLVSTEQKSGVNVSVRPSQPPTVPKFPGVLKKTKECKVCGKFYRCSTQLVEHMRVHTGERPFGCDRCDKTFLRKAQAKEHARTHTGELRGLYVCHLCGLESTSISNLNRHSVVHTGIRAFVCKVCGKGFKTRSALTYHCYGHLTKKLFRCKFCKKRYTHRETLAKHERVHTEPPPPPRERIHQCPVCGKMFGWESVLNIHLQRHSQEPPRFECADCGKMFHDRDSVKRHIVTAHIDDRNYRCSTCGKAFKMAVLMRAHCRRVHGPGKIRVSKSLPASDSGTFG